MYKNKILKIKYSVTSLVLFLQLFFQRMNELN